METRKKERMGRPNHNSKMDVEDMMELAGVKEAAKSPRQRNYLGGGRRGGFHSEISSPTRTSFRDRDTRNSGARGSSRADPKDTDRYARDRPSSFRERATREGDVRGSSRGNPGDTARYARDRPSSFRDRDTPEGNARGGFGENPRDTDRYARDRRPSYATPASDRPNRAARRAASFGPGDTLPGGLKVSRHGSDHYKPDDNPQFVAKSTTPWRAANGRDDTSGESQATSSHRPDRFREHPKQSFLSNDSGTGIGERRSYKLTTRDTEGRERSSPTRLRFHTAGMDEETPFARPHFEETGRYESRIAYGERSPHTRRSRDDERSVIATDVPLTIPYTTPASEFLYGTSVVNAALKFSRRKFYKFYSYYSPDRVNTAQDTAMRNLAASKGVEVMQVQGEWLRILDKMSTGRPHNGYILEASPLPRLPVTGLQPAAKNMASFQVLLDHQSREEVAINGTEGRVEFPSPLARYPFVLMLDGIVDPGNLGALLRTAYFFGVDAVAISTRNCAPLSPVTLKASAGASESLNLLSVSQPENFVEESQKNGWNFFAAVAPDANAKVNKRRPYCSTSDLEQPTMNFPTVLMLGGEGEGLRPNLRKRADYVVGVEGQRLGKGGVDSLNVSVAAGVLCEAFLRKRSGRNLMSSRGPSDAGEQVENSLF